MAFKTYFVRFTGNQKLTFKFEIDRKQMTLYIFIYDFQNLVTIVTSNSMKTILLLDTLLEGYDVL